MKLKPYRRKIENNPPIYTWDSETNGLGGGLLDIGIYNGKDYFLTEDIEKCCEYMVENPGIYFAHNSGRYDTAYVIPWFSARYRCETIFTNSRLLEFRVKIAKGKTLYIRDTFLLLPFSLAKLCESFGVEHKGLKDKNKRTDMLKFKREDYINYITYLKEDCRSLYDCIILLFSIEELKGIDLKYILTPASISMQVFRRDFLDREIDCYIRNTEVSNFIRLSYFGGRTEVFNMNLFKNVTAYDVVSMYPSVMLGNIPIGKPLERHNFKNLNEKCLIMCEVVVTDCFVPPLPYRGDKVLFPIGHFIGVWWYDELQHKNIKIKKIYRVIEFTDSKPIFKNFIQYFYPIKERSKKGSPLYHLSKISLNGLYGKFGQKPEIENLSFMPLYTALAEQEIEGGDIEWYGGEIYWRKEKSIRYSPHMIPHISSFITMKARCLLRSYMEKIPKEKLLYCDTDSCYVFGRNEDYFTESKKLGGMCFDGEYKEFKAFLPKTYIAINKEGKDKSRAKGIQKPSKDKILKGGAYKEDIYPILSSLKGLGLKGEGPLNERRQLKSIKAVYDKRKVNKDGTTYPLTMKV